MNISKNISLAISPCPNDTFIFDALINKRLNAKQTIDFSPQNAAININTHFLDIESLNKKAFNSEFDISKLSFVAYLLNTDKYELLQAGNAIGFDCGPLLISKADVNIENISKLKIAIPGRYTTANLLLDYIYQGEKHKKEYLFTDIMETVASGAADLGLIIHESRFSYRQKGLKLVTDLGDEWQKRTGCPVPLGCIAIKKHYNNQTKEIINKLIRQSLLYAWQYPQASFSFIKKHSAELSDDIINKHINLYVNDYTLNLDDKCFKAIEILQNIVDHNREAYLH